MVPAASLLLLPNKAALRARCICLGAVSYTHLFLQAVMPVCDEYGINMCIHPDDPPFQVLGLPRTGTFLWKDYFP